MTQLIDPKEKKFERAYRRKFIDLTGRENVVIQYEEDVAGFDLGLHLTAEESVTTNRVWFQFKGIHASTLSSEKLESDGFASRSIKVKHLRAWYASPEPVYLIYYIEPSDLFLAEDVRDIVDREWGDEVLNSKLFQDGAEVTVKISTTKKIDSRFWAQLHGHRSMRTDGRSFRGRPLGHSHDPLTTTPQMMDPELFEEVVKDLLAQHDYRMLEVLDPSALFWEPSRSGNLATLTRGVLGQKYEIILQATNEFIPDETGFRIEGASDYAFGPCAVLIHSKVTTPPNPAEVTKLAAELVEKKGIRRLLVFVNGYMLSENMRGCCYFEYSQVSRTTDMKCTPQHLEDLGFNLCLTTNTYNRFRDKITWWGHAIWRKEKGVTVLSPDREIDLGQKQRP
jgi:hypothetical protein